MSKIPLILSGLTAGTAVSGSTHLVKNVNLRQAIVKRAAKVPEDQTKSSRPKEDQRPQDTPGPHNLRSDESTGGQHSLSVKEEEVESAGASTEAPRPSEKTARHKASTENDQREVQDLLMVRASTPVVYRKGQLGRGTASRPDTVCVAEVIEGVNYDYRGRSAQRYRPVCVSTSNDTDYYVANTAEVCTLDINENLGTDLATKLLNPKGKLCRYWDSFKGTNDQQLSFFSEQIPADF